MRKHSSHFLKNYKKSNILLASRRGRLGKPGVWVITLHFVLPDALSTSSFHIGGREGENRGGEGKGGEN